MKILPPVSGFGCKIISDPSTVWKRFFVFPEKQCFLNYGHFEVRVGYPYWKKFTKYFDSPKKTLYL